MSAAVIRRVLVGLVAVLVGMVAVLVGLMAVLVGLLVAVQSERRDSEP